MGIAVTRGGRSAREPMRDRPVSIIRQLKAGVTARWQTLPLSDRRRCMLVSVLTPLALLVAYDARPRPDSFEALASGLTSTEASAVRGHLDDRHVPYVFLDGGQTVMVPAEQRAELTIELTRLALVRSPAALTHVSEHGTPAQPVKRFNRD